MLKNIKYFQSINLVLEEIDQHAILELSDKISKAIDKGEYTIGVLLDLSKAFDTVNNGILLKKLQHYGIRGICLQRFTNYLQES